jgi:uncharacterized protein (TIGR00255 family)
MLSMTGFGEFRVKNDRWNVLVELRSVNNRHLKIITKISEPYVSLEAEIERLVRDRLKRGTVYLTLRIEPNSPVDSYRLNTSALRAYFNQITELSKELNTSPPSDLTHLVNLPGVVLDHVDEGDSIHEDWVELSVIVGEALNRLTQSRHREGLAMSEELSGYSSAIRNELVSIESRIPMVVEEYAQRMKDRVQQILEKYDVKIDPEQLIREVAIFSERTDVAEEITRLKAHLNQFDEIIHSSGSEGRKLEFIVQEMGREINTLGSKSQDVQISRSGVELKSILEKIRELIQNVE